MLTHVWVDGLETISTPDHQYYVKDNGWVNAQELIAGELLLSLSGESVVVQKVSTEMLDELVEVYNLKIDGFHTYFAGNVLVLVHNAKYDTIDEPTDMSEVKSAGKPGSPAWKAAVKEIRAGQGKGKPGINYKVETESQAIQLIKEARPNLLNFPAYSDPKPMSGYEAHPPTEPVHGGVPHIKWSDWSKDSPNRGDGHIFYNTGGK
jgi:intein/homing endonuclease